MKLFRTLWVLLAALFFASATAFAQTTTAGPSIGTAWKPALGGFAMAIASGLCGLGQGRAVASATEAIARNPGAVASIRGALILGLVLIESLALYTLVIVFIL